MPEPARSGARSLLLSRTITVLSFVMLAQIIAGALAFTAARVIHRPWLDTAQEVNAFALAAFALLAFALQLSGRRRKQVR